MNGSFIFDPHFESVAHYRKAPASLIGILWHSEASKDLLT